LSCLQLTSLECFENVIEILYLDVSERALQE